jgi:hypothetical protein
MPVDLSILGLLIFLLEFLIQSSRRNAPPHNRQSLQPRPKDYNQDSRNDSFDSLSFDKHLSVV